MDTPYCPGNAGVPVWITPIKRILIIQVYGSSDSLFRAGCPLKDLLGPVHAHGPVHPAAPHHLPLRRVPQRVVGPGVLELPESVLVFAAVAHVGPRVRSAHGSHPSSRS